MRAKILDARGVEKENHTSLMPLLKFLYELSLLITVGVDVMVLCHVFPAFRRTKNRAFLFLTIACVIGIVDTVLDHTVSLRDVNDQTYIFYRAVRRLTYFTDCILWGVGIVLLARPYLRDPVSPPEQDDTPAKPSA